MTDSGVLNICFGKRPDVAADRPVGRYEQFRFQILHLFQGFQIATHIEDVGYPVFFQYIFSYQTVGEEDYIVVGSEPELTV